LVKDVTLPGEDEKIDQKDSDSDEEVEVVGVGSFVEKGILSQLLVPLHGTLGPISRV
jgi:hypothetical protein